MASGIEPVKNTPFTTDPKDSLSGFSDVLDTSQSKVSKAVTVSPASFNAGITSGGSDIASSKDMAAVKSTVSSLEIDNVVDQAIERCGNMPDFNTRLDFELPSLDLGLDDLPCGLSEKIEELMNDIEAKAKDVVKDTLGQDVKFRKGQDALEIKAQQETVRAFTGSEDVQLPEDAATKTAIYGGLLRQSARFGLHENMQVLVDNAPNGVDKSLTTEYLIGALERPLRFGDVKTAKSITSIVGSDVVLANYPDAIRQLLKGYYLPDGATSTDNVALAEDLVQTLTSIDTNWDKYLGLPTDTPGVYQLVVGDLEPFMDASAEAKEVLSYHERTRIPCLLSQDVERMSIRTSVKAQYKYSSVR